MQLVQVDVRQHDVVITDCDDGIAELLPDLNGPVVVARRKLTNSNLSTPGVKSVIVASTWSRSDDKGIRTAHARHCVRCSASDENIRVGATYELVGSV